MTRASLVPSVGKGIPPLPHPPDNALLSAWRGTAAVGKYARGGEKEKHQGGGGHPGQLGPVRGGELVPGTSALWGALPPTTRTTHAAQGACSRAPFCRGIRDF